MDHMAGRAAAPATLNGVAPLDGAVIDGHGFRGKPGAHIPAAVGLHAADVAVFQRGGHVGNWVYPIVAKAGGLQSQGAKGAAVVNLLQALGNTGSGVLRLSP